MSAQTDRLDAKRWRKLVQKCCIEQDEPEDAQPVFKVRVPLCDWRVEDLEQAIDNI